VATTPEPGKPRMTAQLKIKENEATLLRTYYEAANVVSPAPRDLWRAALSADSGALISQTPEWIDMICAVDGWRDASRLYAWPSGRHVVLPMVAKRICNISIIEESLPQGWGFGGLVGAEGHAG
jgi:hypothetical protein